MNSHIISYSPFVAINLYGTKTVQFNYLLDITMQFVAYKRDCFVGNVLAGITGGYLEMIIKSGRLPYDYNMSSNIFRPLKLKVVDSESDSTKLSAGLNTDAISCGATKESASRTNTEYEDYFDPIVRQGTEISPIWRFSVQDFKRKFLDGPVKKCLGTLIMDSVDTKTYLTLKFTLPKKCLKIINIDGPDTNKLNPVREFFASIELARIIKREQGHLKVLCEGSMGIDESLKAFELLKTDYEDESKNGGRPSSPNRGPGEHRDMSFSEIKHKLNNLLNQNDFNGAAKLLNIDYKTELAGAALSHLDLRGVDLTDSLLEETDFTACDLTNANLSNANVKGTKFSDCVLTNTNFSNAHHIIDARFYLSNINTAIFDPTIKSMNMIDLLLTRARNAADIFRTYTQEQVDKICLAMDAVSVANEQKLAEMAVEETGIGRADHKAIKNHLGAHIVYEWQKDQKSVGVIEEKDGVAYIAEPFGVVAAATPTTNPTSTTEFKSLIALKGRNVVIFAFHPKAQKCSAAAAKLMLDAAVSAGAPADCIQWIEEPSIEATNALFKHPGVNLVLATGGGAMVKSAYSSGHPAIGVGPGNTPVFISKSAKLSVAVNNVIASKTFDNGTICSSDQSMIFDDKATCDKAVGLMKERGAYLVNADEKTKLEAVMFDKERGVPSLAIVGKSPQVIAKLAGFTVPDDVKLLLVPLTTIGPEDWFSHEKLSPVLGYISYNSTDEAISAAKSQLLWGGTGHTAVVHAQDQAVLDKFALEIPANRLLLNQPAVHGSVGLIYNKLPPSLTLGCGTDGGNYLTNNVNYKDLLNIKQVAKRIVDYERDE